MRCGGTTTAAEQLAAGTPEQAQAGMEAWMAWAQRAGDGVVDLGAPLAVVEPGGDAGTIEILEFLSMPRM